MYYIQCGACGSINRVERKEGVRAVCGKCQEPLDMNRLTSDVPLGLSDNTFFDEVLSAKVPVLVDFFATWCGACRSLEPSLGAMAARYKTKLKVGKLDVEQNPLNAARYNIRATPTLILFQEGKPAEQVEGAMPEKQLDSLVQKYIL